jgi:hypothetical protein
MDAYFDSAIIVKLYVQEVTSPDAIRLVGGYAAPNALTCIRPNTFQDFARSIAPGHLLQLGAVE